MSRLLAFVATAMLALTVVATVTVTTEAVAHTHAVPDKSVTLADGFGWG